MKLYRLIFTCLLTSPVLIFAQNLLNKPEHVVFDQLNHRYLVTNYGNGKIVSVDTLGNQEVIIEGIPNCLGIHIIDTIIYITSGQNVHMYGLASHGFIQTIPLTVINWVDGMTDDGAGNLYVAENAGKVHKVNLTTYTDTIIVNSGLPSYPQDLAYDPAENRLLLVCWATNSPIVSIDLTTYTVSSLVETSSGQYDGIVRDAVGNLYVSSWMNGGRVYKWESPYTSGPEVFSQGHAGPAGLALNEEGQQLAVPNFNGNSISFLSLIPVAIGEKLERSEIRIEADHLIVDCQNAGRILITDISGKQVFQESIPSGETRISLNHVLASCRSSVYILSAQTDQGSHSIRYYHHRK